MKNDSVINSLLDSQRAIKQSKKMILDCFKTRLVEILKESQYQFFVFAYGSKEYNDEGFDQGYVDHFIFTDDSSEISANNFWGKREEFYFEKRTNNLPHEIKNKIQEDIKEVFECFDSYSFYDLIEELSFPTYGNVVVCLDSCGRFHYDSSW